MECRYIMFWAMMWPRPDATTDFGEMSPEIVLASRMRRCGLGLAGGRVVVVGAGRGRSEVVGATDGAGSGCAAGGTVRPGEHPARTTTTAKQKIRRIRAISVGTTPGGCAASRDQRVLPRIAGQDRLRLRGAARRETLT
jgi:hypothetical protein